MLTPDDIEAFLLVDGWEATDSLPLSLALSGTMIWRGVFTLFAEDE